MDTNDPATTQLFTGWSSVVHQPCEDEEELELPSTVDIGALNSNNPPIESTNTVENDNSNSDSDSEADSSNSGSDSGSQSNSSDSESSSSSPGGSSSRSPSPEFSVTSSQTNGLRLTFATVKKPTTSPASHQEKSANANVKKQTRQDESSSSSEGSSNESDSGKSGSGKKVQQAIKNGGNNKGCGVKSSSEVSKKIATQRPRTTNGGNKVNNVEKRNGNKGSQKTAVKTRKRATKKMASSLSRNSTSNSSSDTDDESDCESEGDILASCSLQEIREEDLAAILPDQNECNDFNDFESKNGKSSPATGDMSGSDMELPQQAINSLIQRTTESSSESEMHAAPNPNTLYANSLLQQFVAQTQMLNAPSPPVPNTSTQHHENSKQQSTSAINKDSTDSQSIKSETSSVKRRRGRPRGRLQKGANSTASSQDFCAVPNVSPDSGIQNSPDHVSSPEPILPTSSTRNNVKSDINNKNPINKNHKSKQYKREVKQHNVRRGTAKNTPNEMNNKISVTSNRFDRALYANCDRTLYPPRKKDVVHKKGPGRPPKNKTIEGKNKQSHITNNKSTNNNNKISTNDNSKPNNVFKVPKLMHSKHKHRHRKRKFKILKTVTTTTDPKLHLEIEKMATDFVKMCSITGVINNAPNVNTSNKENFVAEQATNVTAKPQKKITKKRRTTEESKKKKKTNPNTTISKVANNSNEQRLPLKKRHYHLLSNNNNNNNTEDTTVTTENTTEAVSNKTESPPELEVTPTVSKTTDPIQHIDEAIEACINKFATVDQESPKKTSNVVTTATTPKKRHRLDQQNVVTVDNSVKEKIVVSVKLNNLETNNKISVESFLNELKNKRNLIQKTTINNYVDSSAIKQEKVTEESVQVAPENTKKKVRKRRAINRTGFPSVKKKKKKVVASDITTTTATVNATAPTLVQNICDRVPKEGEEYTKFMQRCDETGKKTTITSESCVGQIIESDCDSLPVDEKIMEIDDGPDDNSNLKPSRKRRKLDKGGNTELSLESSIERLKSRLEQKSRKCRREDIVKRRLDTSPASGTHSANASGDEMKMSKKELRAKKKYLVAGLFSDHYKGNEDAFKQQDPPKSNRLNTQLATDQTVNILPPPDHCGKTLRKRLTDYELPYDIWWLHTQSQLPASKESAVPSWNYKKIRTNLYNVKSNGGACEPQTCNCKPPSNCGDDCINRLVLVECPATHRCQNQRIQRHEWAPGIEKFMTRDKGWGVRTNHPIKSGDFILEYVGEVVSDQEFKERMHSIYLHDTHHYCLHLDGGLVIDGHRMGSEGRFVNHSCQPNCEIQKWSVNGQFRMALFALRDITALEELTYDYNFTLFNPAEGQECKCGNENCRGVIGGKSQRIRQLPNDNNPVKNPGRVGRPRKTEAKKKPTTPKDTQTSARPLNPIVPQIMVKPMSHQQKCFIVEHHCFLLRNLTKVRKVRDRSTSVASSSRQQAAGVTPTPLSTNQSTSTSAFKSQLNALQNPRNMRTRKMKQAEDDPELSKIVKLASLLKDVWNVLATEKDAEGKLLCAGLQQMPSRRKVPEFYQQITDPLDMAIIEKKIAAGTYKTPHMFDEDVTKLFNTYLVFYGRASEIGLAIKRLKSVYFKAKKQIFPKVENVLGEKTAQSVNSNKKKDEEDIIRCICGIPRDEGLMIQCEKCMVWQHCECVKADTQTDFLCEICGQREVNYEIPTNEFTEEGHRYYMSLMRSDLQLSQGDTVYVLRDITIPGTNKKHTYQTIGEFDYGDLDIFRIEWLYKDKNNGNRYAYGHHYLRPHETFHEPTRKFFPNEVLRVPLYETVPVELIISKCWVLDINTYCKGRPIGASDEHIYICEYRVDRSAKAFSKITAKNKYSVCTKSFAFENFETRLKISRTYCPHDVDINLLKKGRKSKKPDENQENQNVTTTNVAASSSNCKEVVNSVPTVPVVVKTRAEKKSRLNGILLNLLVKMPTKEVLDCSYLLEGGRRRKKADK